MPSSSTHLSPPSPAGADTTEWGLQAQRRSDETARVHVGAGWGAAVVGVLALVSARAFGPALAGVWVGSDRLVGWVELGTSILAQSFALLGLASILGLSLLLARGERSVVVRALGVGVAGLVAMAMASAMFAVLPALSGLVAGLGAAFFALLVGGTALRRRGLRWLALLLSACALAGAVRMASFALLELLGPDSPSSWTRLAHIGVSVAVAFDAVTIALGLGWLLGPRPRLSRLLLTVLGVVLVCGWTWGASRGAQGDATEVTIWLQRALRRLVVGPVGELPLLARMTVEAAALTLAVVAVARPASTRLGAAVVTLALVGRTALEAPSCALALLLAALLVAFGVAHSSVAVARDAASPSRRIILWRP